MISKVTGWMPLSTNWPLRWPSGAMTLSSSSWLKALSPEKASFRATNFCRAVLEAVVVKRLYEVVRHAVGVQLADVPGLAGGGDHDHIGQDALGPEFDEKVRPSMTGM